MDKIFPSLWFFAMLCSWGYLVAKGVESHWYWFFTWPYALGKFWAVQS